MGEGWTRSSGTDRRRLAKSRKTEVHEKARMMMAAKIQTHPKPSRTSSGFNISFTAASLRPELARIVAEHYLAAGDWDLAKQRILSSNALQCRSAGSAVRLEREFRQRLEPGETGRRRSGRVRVGAGPAAGLVAGSAEANFSGRCPPFALGGPLRLAQDQAGCCGGTWGGYPTQNRWRVVENANPQSDL